MVRIGSQTEEFPEALIVVFGPLYNDFSYAPTNAVEVIFSRNRILGNHLRGSGYGVWSCYSWRPVLRASDAEWNARAGHGLSSFQMIVS